MNEAQGFGSKLGYRDLAAGGGSGTGVFTQVAKTKDVGSPSSPTGSVEVIHNDLEEATAEYIPGLTKHDTYDVAITYDKSQSATLTALKQSRATKEWMISIPDGENGADDGSTFTFKGFVVNLVYESTTDDGLWEGTLTIQPSGKPTFDPAAASA